MKLKIRESRIDKTKLLNHAICAAAKPPGVFVSLSGVGRCIIFNYEHIFYLQWVFKKNFYELSSLKSNGLSKKGCSEDESWSHHFIFQWHSSCEVLLIPGRIWQRIISYNIVSAIYYVILCKVLSISGRIWQRNSSFYMASTSH